MTTEAGTETEVKEKAEESAAQPDQLDQSEKAPEETKEVVAAEGDKKEKEGKGISRYLPTWLKKQKSQNLTSPTKDVPISEESVGNETEPKEGAPPEVNGHAEEEEQEKEEKKETENLEQVNEREAEPKADVKEETEPVREEKVEEEKSEDKSAEDETKAVPEEEKTEEEQKGLGKETSQAPAEGEKETQTSLFQSPLKLVRKNKMKLVVCHVTLLDGTDYTCEVEKRVKGQYLFFKVCEHLNLMEKDYFGLTYKDNHDHKCWLDPTKEIKRQIRSNNWQFSFNVKFYPPDPSLLTEDLTRYLLCLQLREDVASGKLPCSFVTHALLGSYTLQAELGDYEPDQPKPLDYMSQLTFAPNQNKEMEEKILELHKSHRGMTPAQADVQFLENAKKLSMYGVDLHHAKDSEGVDIMLGVCANGLLVYKDKLRINRFAWPKILKISYKRNNFYIKIRPGEAEQFESTVGFKLQNHRLAKRLWKVCVENHSFFRLNTPEPPNKARFLTLGSKFRYSGRTQAQTRVASSLIDRPAPNFERTSSKRISRSLDGAPMISITDTSAGENGREPHLELNSDSKVDLSPGEAKTATTQQSLGASEAAPSQDHDKTQDEVLKHQASISQLKRSFMEAPPPSPPQPNLWEKRLTSSPATIRVQPQPVVIVSQLETSPVEIVTSEPKELVKTAEVEIEETVVVQEVSKATKPMIVTVEKVPSEPVVKIEEAMTVSEEEKPCKQESVSSESESEEEAEYHPNVTVSISHTQIPEEKEEEIEEEQVKNDTSTDSPPVAQDAPPTEAQQVVEETKEVAQPKEEATVVEEKPIAEPEIEESTDDPMVTPEEAPNGLPLADEDATLEEEPKMNGQPVTVETERHPQVICCTEPPVVKTEMVTISDTFAAQKTEIATKEVPIVHTETKTITYEAAQLEGNGDAEPGVLMTAQTITSESLCTTTTTHITKTLKGGLSETRIEKRIVITGDCDIDHDEALAQAIKEAKEQHPDMSVTRVVVHKETELAEEED
ncbi:band 4.1-like protein 2 isoform X1 [Periophthalmus magnuspinnatus]|uniref:band 4.1-like protein 2 isoform X1 n=1 Tax=Periophthalmus magnuspinnatus TaxID=409849 RepID=UPI00145A6015|nr:band 4.1-like protein 2 isoform X1 [Periophthalmus magnuspinnatus]XP_055088073.1 band 4.1-like protein 2 isoform X1 [Periophthalmus magnuspinnatus]